MAQVESYKKQIVESGAQWIFIAAEKREGVFQPSAFLAKHPVSFPFLLDEDRAVTKAYGLYHRVGTDALNIAHPATLVVNSAGTIVVIYRGDNQRHRAPIEPALEAVQSAKF